MCVDPISVSSILLELPLVDVSVGMVEGALALSHAIPPVSVVGSSIWPYLDSLTMLNKDRLSIYIQFRRHNHLACIRSPFAHFVIALVFNSAFVQLLETQQFSTGSFVFSLVGVLPDISLARAIHDLIELVVF